MDLNYLKQFISFAEKLADASEKVIMPYFKGNVNITEKKDSSPVTEADLNAEKEMRRLIEEEYPEHGIIGEEFGRKNPDAEFVWVLDPIDGTKSFIHGVPIFGTLIALLMNNKPLIGMINFPALQERVSGATGLPTRFNGKIINTTGNKNISDATVLCTDHLDLIKARNEQAFIDMVSKAKLYRGWGDCYMYALVARGKADIAIDPLMSYWDIQALIPIVRGASGTITGYKGEDPENADGMIASASQELHDFVIKSLNP